MPIRTYQNTPYVDDYHVNDLINGNKTAEEKNFLRILFKPGVSVQVRELNQMQSILQNQIDKMGKGVFKEGPVPDLADEAHLERNLSFVDIDVDSEELITSLIPYIDRIKKLRVDVNSSSPTSTEFIDAEVLHYEELAEVNRFRFYVKYITSVQVNGDNVQEFDKSLGQIVELAEDVILPTSTYGENYPFGSVVNEGAAIQAKVNKGTYFLKGEFVHTDSQSIYAALPVKDYNLNLDISFKINEIIVNYQMDKSLLDNAAGYPNERAPGSDRYTIDLELIVLSKNASVNDGLFIESNPLILDRASVNENVLSLITVENSVVVQVARPEFSAMIDILAERTREESGDYAVDPFVIDIKDFYNDIEDEKNRGVHSLENMLDLDIVIPEGDISNVAPAPNGDVDLSTLSEADRAQYGESRFIVGVEPSVAYVDGYRVENEQKIDVIVPKARETNAASRVHSTARLGSYILGDSIEGVPEISIEDSAIAEIIDANSIVIGACRIRSIEYNGNKYKLYIHDVTFNVGKSFVDAANITQIGGFDFTVDATSSGVFDSEFNYSIFKLPADFVSTFASTGIGTRPEFTIRTVLSPGASASATNIIIITAPINGRFEESGENSFIVIRASDNATIPVIDYEIDPTNSGLTNQAQLTLASSLLPNEAFSVVASYRGQLTESAKTVHSVTQTLVATDGVDITSGEIFQLDRHDVIALTEAQDISGAAIPIEHFEIIDDGQRDGRYELSKVRYNGPDLTDLSDPVRNGLVLKYRYHRHGSGNYFSVNSYSSDYGDIPNYKDLRLADSLDFRPRTNHVGVVDDDDNVAYSVVDAGTYLDPNSTIDSTISYYLSRIDKLVATKNSEFKMISGIPNVKPMSPSTPPDSMHLYTVFVPAYTFSPRDIFTDFVDNRRYTMRDIGEIESRVQNLEYYTSLSLLEREANGKQIFDSDAGNPYDRFKNGIIVDSFQGHSVGNVLDKNYQCSMDPDENVLRPYFESRNVPLALSTNNNVSNVVINDGVASLSYSENAEPFVSQQKASVNISVNPYDVSTWLGKIALSPSSDEWMETRRAPDVINEVGGNLADLKAEVARVNALGTQWNSWQTSWTGKPKVTKQREWRRGQGIPWGRGPNRGWLRWTTWNTVQSEEIRQGIKTTASVKTVTKVKDDRVIDVSFVPFIRARKIYFKGELFKPKTKLNLFFDGKDITQYATSIISTEFKQWSENATVRTYYNQSSASILPTRNDIITDHAGSVTGWFVIPNNKEHQFPTGERRIVLTDGKTASDAGSTTNGDAVYTATGKAQTKQRTLITTRSVVKREARASQSRIKTTRGIATRTQWYDPLAQSFIIGETPTGLYMSSVNLYFSHVSTKSIPLKMYLVEMENGTPTQNRVPMSEVTKMPDEVATSADATAATTFTFDAPIYLQYGIEFAIVTESNSSEYRQWLSEVGGTDVNTNEFISKNPFLGVSFKSQNASTWTPDQSKDFKMELMKAEYAQSGYVILNAVGIEPELDELNAVIEGTSDGVLEYSQVQLNVDFVEHLETELKFEISVNGSEYEIITPNENHYIATGVGQNVSTNDAIKIKATFKSENSNVTPILDLDRISLITIKNIINSDNDVVFYNADSVLIDSELDASHGTAEAVYMTREVILNNPSDRLDSYLNINRMLTSSNIRVYARFKRSEEAIEALPFELIDSNITVPVNDYGDYSEIKYTKDFSNNSALALFNSFQVKIVMTSSRHDIVPTVKDFRAIATI